MSSHISQQVGPGLLHSVDPPETSPSRDVTLLFSDVVGSTELIERLGDLESHRVIRRHHRVVQTAAAEYGGEEVEVRGDGFLFAFDRASQAIRCAAAIQLAVTSDCSDHPEQPVRVRIGVHSGVAIPYEHGYFGKDVILSSRIADLAHADEILVSSQLKERVDGETRLGFDEGREVQLKGFSRSHRVFRVAWGSGHGEADSGLASPERYLPAAALAAP